MASQTRNHLLEGASRVILQKGGRAFTLEAVAREAGVSKGALLYHFPSKEALIKGLITRSIERFEMGITKRLKSSPPGAGRWIKAYARTWFDYQETALEFNAGLLAAVANDPALLAEVRSSYRAWQTRVDADGIDPAVAAVVRLAIDGLWLADTLGFAPPTRNGRKALLRRLEAMIDGATRSRRAGSST